VDNDRRGGCTFDESWKPKLIPYTYASFILQMGRPARGTIVTKYGAANTLENEAYARIDTDGKVQKGEITKSYFLDEYGVHAGVDIDSTQGLDLYAVADGLVGIIIEANNGGNKIVIEHPYGKNKIYAVYLHVGAISVDTGDHVSLGTPIGSMENDHLHFELRMPAGINLDASGNYQSFPETTQSWWANSAHELKSRWVDISSKFGGYDKFLPEDWR
jgi:murein DD-endopeptidase MepM/ murein hydrolase activator NlpD